MKFSTVNLYPMKFIFRCGAILDLTRDDLERSMTLDDENMLFRVKYRNTMTNNLSQNYFYAVLLRFSVLL